MSKRNDNQRNDNSASPTVGARILRNEDGRFLRGQGRYTADIQLPRMLHAAFLRSPVAHARIAHLDVDRARQLPGVYAVYTGEELQRQLALPLSMPIYPNESTLLTVPVLAVGKVRFPGDPVAVVVAVDRYVAEDALDCIDVTYQNLPAQVNTEEACRPDAALVDESLPSNAVAHYTHRCGDVDRAFAEADHVLSFPYYQHRQTHTPMETRGCVAEWHNREQTLTLYTSTQRPHLVRDALSPLLGLPRHRVRVVAPDVGGGFGQKAALHREEVALSLLARLTRRPVKWIEDRRESLMASAHAREETCYLDVAVRQDGTILAIKVRLYSDMGAYPSMISPPHLYAQLIASMIAGPWRFDNFAYDAFAVLTNKCPITAYRAPMMMSNVVHQHLIQGIAQALKLDPVELYRKHVIQEADQPYRSPNGETLDKITVAQTLDRALELIDYPAFRRQQDELRAQGRYLGIGFGNFAEKGALSTPEYLLAGLHPHGYSEVGWTSSTIRIEASGEITLLVGSASQGQGHETTLAQVVAHELGVEVADVVVKAGDSERDPYGPGTIASQTMVSAGGAVQRSTQQIKAKILRIAGQLLEVAPEDLEVRRGGRIGVKGVPSTAPRTETTLSEVARVAYFDIAALPDGDLPGLEVTSTYEPPHSVYYSGTHVAMIEVDTATGKVKILRYLAVTDCGTSVNPKIVEGQVLGGVAQGLSGVLFENAAYAPDGAFLASTLFDYMLPMAADMPPVEMAFLDLPPDPDLPYGAKPVAEGGVVGAAPAIINAIADALSPLGVALTHQPFTPDKIRQLLRQAGH